MNYIEQINVFWKLDAEHSFNGNESRLYFYLLNLSNSLYWKNPLTNADGHTATMVGISVNTLKSVRNRLKQAGLIQFKTGGNGSRNKCQYWITPAAQVLRENANKVSNFDTLSNESLTPYLIPGLQNPDDINKLKPDKTKPRESSPPKKNEGGWNTKPSNDELSLELQEITLGAVVQQFRFTKNIIATSEQVLGLWAIFKVQNFNGEKFYQSPKQVFSHFINWCQTKDLKSIPAEIKKIDNSKTSQHLEEVYGNKK